MSVHLPATNVPAKASCRIRLAARADIAAIQALYFAAYGIYRSCLSPEFFDLYIADACAIDTRWRDMILLVAETDGRVTGAVSFFADAGAEGVGLPTDWAGFRWLAVDPLCQGQGIGWTLVEHCMDLARTFRQPAIGIHTAEFMLAARGLYERMGFCRLTKYDVNAASFLAQAPADLKVLAYCRNLIAEVTARPAPGVW